MSLHVYLHEGEDRYCDKCGQQVSERECVYVGNVTHNLTTMADQAGIAYALWEPEKHGINEARELLAPLSQGIEKLLEDPARFKKYDPPNEWGSYAVFVQFVTKYLEACKEHPDATVEAR